MKKTLVRFSLVLVISGTLVAAGGVLPGKTAKIARGGMPPGAESKIMGFHIDMNIAQFRGEYLKERLKRLAGLGYNAILWEVENNIRWETCPECVSPDAFTKEEFKDILSYSRALGLEPIPLLQTIGHCEYVLKNEKYRRLAELPGRIDQYCPQNPEVVSFLEKWIDEYLGIFGNVRYFHLGADEAYALGECPLCRAYAEKSSLSELYVSHLNTLSRPLADKGIRPIIWGDMILHHPEALDHLSRKIVIFDWLYDRYLGCGQVNIWGQGNRGKDDLDAVTLKRFGPYLYPFGDEPGRDPDPFYTAAYLQDLGFDVVLCPSSSCYGDSVYAPRTYFHMRNTADSFRQGLAEGRQGAVLTSWTVHLFPWELQETSIELPAFVAGHPESDLADYEKSYVRDHFGVEDSRFFTAAGRLAKRGLFNYAADLGFYKDANPAPKDYIINRLDELAKTGSLEKEAEGGRARLEEYRQGAAEFREYSKIVKKGHPELALWDLAARNLINRAEAALVLLKDKTEGHNAATRKEAGRVLGELRTLRRETAAAYATRIKPHRTQEMLQWMYDSVETALEKAAAGPEKEKPKEKGAA
jgi:Glycosyl hydrolase family 20, catalytic domain